MPLAAGGLVMAVTAPLAVAWILAKPGDALSGPDDTVRAYFTALADRDAGRARSLLSEGVDEKSGRTLLSEETLRDPGYRPPQQARVEVTDDNNGIANVLASYHIDGTPQQMSLTLELDKDRKPPRWSINTGLLMLRLPHPTSQPEAFVVAGTRMPADGLIEGVFPGDYRVELPDNPIQEASPVTARAGTHDSGYLRVKLRDSARQSIEAQAWTYVNECVASTELAPPGCPFSASSIPPVTNVTWTMTQRPVLEITLQSDGSIRVVSTSGMLKVTGRTRSKDSPSFSESIPFSVYGTGQAADDRVVFMPR